MLNPKENGEKTNSFSQSSSAVNFTASSLKKLWIIYDVSRLVGENLGISYYIAQQMYKLAILNDFTRFSSQYEAHNRDSYPQLALQRSSLFQ